MSAPEQRLSGDSYSPVDSILRDAVRQIEDRVEGEKQRKRKQTITEVVNEVAFFSVIVLILAVGFLFWKVQETTALVGGERPLAFLGAEKAEKGVSGVIEKGVARFAVQPSVIEKMIAQGNRKVEEIERRDSPEKRAVAMAGGGEKAFADGELRYWKDAGEEDTGFADADELVFTGLIPEDGDGYMFVEMHRRRGEPMKVYRLMDSGKGTELANGEFAKLTAGKKYLVAREGRVFLASDEKGVERKKFPVPARGQSYNPARAELGPLYDLLPKLKVRTPLFRYQVFVSLKALGRDVPVATVEFGEAVTRKAVEDALGFDDGPVSAKLLSEARLYYRND